MHAHWTILALQSRQVLATSLHDSCGQLHDALVPGNKLLAADPFQQSLIALCQCLDGS